MASFLWTATFLMATQRHLALHAEFRASGTNTWDPGANRPDQSLGTRHRSSSFSIVASQIDQLFISIRPQVILGCDKKVVVRTTSNVVSQSALWVMPLSPSVFTCQDTTKVRPWQPGGHPSPLCVGPNTRKHNQASRILTLPLPTPSPN